MGTNNRSKYDLEAVRSAANGRWIDILSQIGGLPGEVLRDSSREHPCPKCGGDTRFRMIDEAVGAVRCSHCFSEKCGDGFAAISWSTGCTFPEAVEKVATYCGVKPREMKQNDPVKDLEFQPWSSQLVQLLLAKKPGVTEQAMLAAGAKLAKYKGKYTVYAFPVIGQDLNVDAPVGWLLLDFQGNPLPVWDKDGNVVRTVKMKLTSGSKPGLLGVHGCERMKVAGLVQRVRKVEGLTDLLCLWSQQPESERDSQIILSTANGSMETPRWQASTMASYDVDVIHDADEPGQVGAATWTQAIALQQSPGRTVRNVKLPYEIEPTHGKDLRDFFNDGNKWRDFEALIDKAEVKVIARTAEGAIEDQSQVEYPVHETIMKLLQIEVMEEDENSCVHIFSTFLGKISKIGSVSRLKMEDLIQYCGKPAMQHVSSTADGADHEKVFPISEVRKAIAYTASTRRGRADRCGVGVWQGLDDYGNETKTVVVVNRSKAARWNGDQVLRPVIAPRVDGLVLNFGAENPDWFEFEKLEFNLVSAADVAWRTSVIEKCEDFFRQWRWKNPICDPTIVTGLVLASWIQTLWEWRPLVAIVGESHSGKSYLFEAISGGEHRTGLLGNLSFRCSGSTEAAIRQTLSNTAQVPFIDEFEKSKERDAILKKILRPSTRGDIISRGTVAQKTVEFRVRHIAWIAAIESGLKEQADVNRFIQLELLRATAKDEGKLTLPDGRALYELGQKLLAIAVRCAIEAKALAVKLRTTKVTGIDPRTIEGYAVPISILAVAQGMDDEAAQKFLVSIVEMIETHDQGTKDHEDLLDSIMTSIINCGGKDGLLSVSQILEGGISGHESSRFYDHQGKLEAKGIRLTKNLDLFVYHRQVSQDLLRQTPWEGRRLDQLLLRLPGAKRETQRLGGRIVKGISIPSECLEFGDDPEDIQEPTTSMNGSQTTRDESLFV